MTPETLLRERDEARRLVLWALDLLPPSIGKQGALEAAAAWGEVPAPPVVFFCSPGESLDSSPRQDVTPVAAFTTSDHEPSDPRQTASVPVTERHMGQNAALRRGEEDA